MESSQNWTSFWGHFYAFYVVVFFLKVKVQNGDIFLGCKKFQIFLGCLIFLILFGGVNGRCWVQAYVERKKIEYPPLGLYI